MFGEDIAVDAGEDLNAADEGQYRAINIAGLLADNCTEAYGLLQNKPKSGEDAAVRFSGRSRFQTGGAVNSGSLLTVSASGWITASASGDAIIGRCIVGVASGGIGQGIFNFAAPGRDPA